MGGDGLSAWTSPSLPPSSLVPAHRHAVEGGSGWPFRHLSVPSWTLLPPGCVPAAPLCGSRPPLHGGAAQAADGVSWVPLGSRGDDWSTRASSPPRQPLLAAVAWSPFVDNSEWPPGRTSICALPTSTCAPPRSWRGRSVLVGQVGVGRLRRAAAVWCAVRDTGRLVEWRVRATAGGCISECESGDGEGPRGGVRWCWPGTYARGCGLYFYGVTWCGCGGLRNELGEGEPGCGDGRGGVAGTVLGARGVWWPVTTIGK